MNTKAILKSIAGSIVAGVVLCLATGCGHKSSSTTAHVDNKNIVVLSKNNFHAEVLSSSQPVLVDFWAEWCGPCKAIAPIVSEVATEFEGRLKVGKVDVDSEPAIAKEYDISAIPTLMIFKDGKKVEQLVGFRDKGELTKVVRKYVAATATPAPAPAHQP